MRIGNCLIRSVSGSSFNDSSVWPLPLELDLCASFILVMQKCASALRMRCFMYPNQLAAYRTIRMFVSDTLFVPRYADVLSFERNAFIRSFVVCVCVFTTKIHFALLRLKQSERKNEIKKRYSMEYKVRVSEIDSV